MELPPGRPHLPPSELIAPYKSWRFDISSDPSRWPISEVFHYTNITISQAIISFLIQYDSFRVTPRLPRRHQGVPPRLCSHCRRLVRRYAFWLGRQMILVPSLSFSSLVRPPKLTDPQPPGYRPDWRRPQHALLPSILRPRPYLRRLQ